MILPLKANVEQQEIKDLWRLYLKSFERRTFKIS